MQQLIEAHEKKLPNIMIANIVIYLSILKEDNLMKKILLDICFKEIK